ncbi:hypothetical protein [Mycolicibacterium komossense]|uniref:Uncharacterized protein n=1 Tax=Mycolicibacterium komossense TaxID=1779 RepID=A0ABT3C5B3_9MYCO|nr:hypothetical protein [Mycolicibacterium komossense]MCV7224610.1 hypothetical protein [Mycolicibacterium komossense]
MFRALADRLNPPKATDQQANGVLSTYPMQLSRFLDEVWSAGGLNSATWNMLLAPATLPSTVPVTDAIGDVGLEQEPQGLLTTLTSGLDYTTLNKPKFKDGNSVKTLFGGTPPLWDHMIYAYLIEATGIFEIMADVVRRYVVGETLPYASPQGLAWVRGTEELFFRDPPLFSTSGALMSQVRPDAAINRRNAYWRMFGMDLPHPVGRGVTGQPWKRDVGSTINTRFLELWNELLRQVWLGFENATNSSGAKPTDPSYVAYLCQTLSEMLRLRRQFGMLAREEFAFVTMMDWFHLTVQYDTAIVVDLKATAGPDGNPADRLAAIGARVGVAPSRQSRELFELADLASSILWAIELGIFNTSGSAALLFANNLTTNPIVSTMNRIIDLWQSATGERVKDLAVTTRRQGLPQSAQPSRLLPGPLVPTARPAAEGRPSTNGHRPTSLTRG